MGICNIIRRKTALLEETNEFLIEWREQMIAVEDNFKKNPICPFCDTEINKLYTREMRSFLGRRYLYFCSNCLKVLGLSHRKGFWMG
jgi:hypothetical protein